MTIYLPSAGKKRKRILLVANHFRMEPLGLLYLAGAVKYEMPDWEAKVFLVEDENFQALYDEIEAWKPDRVGIQIWTGWHLQALAACDHMRAMGVSLIIGGPHATYYAEECAAHADVVMRGYGFTLFKNAVEGNLAPGVHFDHKGRDEPFPLPDRDMVYEAYPDFGENPMKSIFASVGCPFTCSYCYAPSFNNLHGKFKFIASPMDRIIMEAQEIKQRWPLKLIYFQDDIFGFNLDWLKDFAARWKAEVGVPFHCQLRLELTRHDVGEQRLNLLQEAGCTGVTMAIESGNQFLRDRVLFRHMPHELILEGCRMIMDRGMTLRTQQILAVPFSDTKTDLATLGLNNEINPTMAWTSILSPYRGTDIGTVTSNLGFYNGNNDDLSDTFYDRSILRHVEGGPKDIEPVVEALGVHPKAPPASQPLVNMKAVEREDRTADLIYKDAKVGEIRYLTPEANERYATDTVRLQRLFNWLAKVPSAQVLGRKLVDVPDREWSWANVGRITEAHMRDNVPAATMEKWKQDLAAEMDLPKEDLPKVVEENPWFFVYYPAGGTLAKKVADKGMLEDASFEQGLDAFEPVARQHLHNYGLLGFEKGAEAIAH